MLQFDFEQIRLQVGTSYTAKDLLNWIADLHSALVDSGAWDRLNSEFTEIAQELTVLAAEAER